MTMNSIYLSRFRWEFLLHSTPLYIDEKDKDRYILLITTTAMKGDEDPLLLPIEYKDIKGIPKRKKGNWDKQRR